MKKEEEMRMFHKHIWKEVERFYAPPTDKNVDVGRGCPGSLEKLIFGVTTIHFICKCEEHKFVEVLGKKG